MAQAMSFLYPQIINQKTKREEEADYSGNMQTKIMRLFDDQLHEIYIPLYFFSNADDAFCFSLPSPKSNPIYIASQDGLSEVLPFGHDRCTASPLPILNSLSTTFSSVWHLAEGGWSILPVCLCLLNYNILRWSYFSVGKCSLTTTLTQLISLSTSSPNIYRAKGIQGWAFPASASSRLTRCHTSSSR